MLLALDTATRYISLALYDGASVAAEHSWRTGAHHTVELAPQVALLLRRVGVATEALKGVAVAIGPGSYTGLRIGLGFAKGLAFAHSLPLFGVPTFEILMHAQLPTDRRVLAVLEAGRGRVIVAAYAWLNTHWQAEGEPAVTNWATLAADVLEPTMICGEWQSASPEVQRALKSRAIFTSPARTLRRASNLAELAWERLLRGEADNAEALTPLYAGQPEGLQE
ncbi:MAG: tRNA (adenosine(37)-N6)-threonylcarbamoyltransferase complex dimerization subunit type 1 TsaB [Anaerolineales bacterium]|nr:tRNA (adenosine(37)-N6)-threonylcarbamoyltransferase complex dimerization subunit type 1 TsaB [Anaerolineales bacterium]